MGNKNGESRNNRQPPSRPYLSGDDADHLARMNVELLSELWIARDRIAVLEQILVEKGVISPTEIDEYVPDQAMADRLGKLRKVVIESVIGAPFKNNHTVETLKAQGQALASVFQTASPKKP